MTIVLKLAENTKGRDFVVGDIHGAYDLLDKALIAVGFDPEKDRLISVGDLIDRGAQSAKCLEYLKQPWFFAVKGNHEDMFLDTVKNGKIDSASFQFNLQNGMGWIAKESPEKLREIEAAFQKLPLAIEIDTPRGTAGFVHADVPADMDWQTFTQQLIAGDDKTIQTALWGRSRVRGGNDDGVVGIDRLFFGHTPQAGGAVRLGNCYFVDTGAVFREMLAEQGAAYHLTMADILCKTNVIAAPVAPQKPVVLLTDVPPAPKPFGIYQGPKKS